MPPKKIGGAAAASAVASPAAKKKKRLTTATPPGPAKTSGVPPAKKRQDADGTAPQAGDTTTLPAAAATAFDGDDLKRVGPGDHEGFDEAHADAGTEDAAAAVAVTAADHRGDAPAEETAVDAAAFGGEVNGSVGREEPTPVVAKVGVGEEMGVAATATGLPSEKGLDGHVATGAEGAEGASASAMVESGDSGPEITAAEVAASNEEEDVMLEVEDGPRARSQPSSAAAADIDSADALPVASAVTAPPAPMLLLLQQMVPPSLFIPHGVDELRGLSTALSTFIRCWDRLSHHLDCIQASMDALSRSHGVHGALPTPATGGKRRPEEMEWESGEKKKGEGVGEAEEKDVGGAEEAKKSDQPQKAPPLDLESICEKMLGRNLRRYVVAHMSDVDRLREEVPRALRLAPDPAKLVLSCIGRFYLQGSRAYADPNSPMVSVRRACILVLELFLLSGCPFSGSVRLTFSSSDATTTDAAHTETAEGRKEPAEGKEEPSSSVLEEAKVAAVAWKNRLVAEGGIASASAVDALGLALFVASFGIPPDFDSEMMYGVFRLCNMKKKADILRQSPIIVEKVPDVIQDLVQKEKYIAAADLACGFGLQEKYPPLDLISSFLIKTNTDVNEERREGQSSVTSQKEAAACQLAAYKSVIKCLEDHKLDPSSLASFKIEEKISEIEKDIAKFERKLKDKNLKRKAENVERTYGVKGPAKRPASTLAKTTSVSLSSRASQDHGRALSLSRELYGSSSNRFSGLLDGGGVGNLAGNVLGPTGAGSRLAATSSLFVGSVYSVGNGILPSAESGGVEYRWYHEGAMSDGSIGHSYAGMGHSGPRGLMGPSTESLLQPPASPLGTESRVMGSSLYEFADNVMENESYYGHSVRSNVLSNSASGYR